MPAGAPPPGPIPTDPASSTWPPERRHRRDERGGALVFGVILILIGGFLLLRQMYPLFDIGRFWPLIFVLIGVALLATSFGRRAAQ
jgi:hypothetical protein